MDNTVTIQGYGYIAKILPERGANCISIFHLGYNTEALHSPIEISDFETKGEFFWGTPILFPPNRLENGAFYFENRKYSFPINEPKLNNSIHGMLHRTPFQVIKATGSSVTLSYSATKQKPYMTFPHEFTVTVKYSAEPSGIHQITAIRNDSKQNMPFALGFHTSFNAAQGNASVRLSLSTGNEVIRSNFLPTGELVKEHLYKHELDTSGIMLDNQSISKHYEIKPPHKMTLKNFNTDISVTYTVDSKFKYWLVYKPENCDFICVEPQTWMANCPNAPFDRNKTGFKYLEPNAEAVYYSHISIEPLT